MREIKFRVFDKDYRKMHIVGEDGHDSLTCWDGKIQYYNLQNGEGSGEHGSYILMQYTGLTDKNGKEIYEGDVVTNELYKTENVAFECYFAEKEGMFKLSPFIFKNNGRKIGNKELTLQLSSVRNKEIIGNIYQHPHLLEGDK